ncbi:hypothetical protein SASPL_142533 [Salvia splendens]|uniref:60S acidic ribosomal protein P3 n=1 Tax=Salvia splendens TaxID=180675 RepID=A0A8X8WKC7_SALSN|nr:hypothetical protein SASPL_142533 [Salvia splendens]
MGVFTFVCRESGSDWSAKQLNGDLEATGDCAFTLQRNLVQAALSAASGAVQSSFSYVTPKSAVFQVFRVALSQISPSLYVTRCYYCPYFREA